MTLLSRGSAPDGRKPARSSRDEFVDQLRGVAIFLVLLYHSLGTGFGTDSLKWDGLLPDFNVSGKFLLFLPLTLGWSGVAIFFAISGFCIHSSFSKEAELGIFRYIVKRTFRIYPPFLFSLLLFSFVYPWHAVSITPLGNFGNFTAHVALVHNFFTVYYFGINPSFWSIAVEFQLYLIYIIIIYFIARVGWKITLSAVFVVEVSVRLIESFYIMQYDIVPSIWVGNPLGYVFSWAVGAWVAERCKSIDRTHKVAPWMPAMLLIAAISCAFFKPLAAFSFMLFSSATAVMILYVHDKKFAFGSFARSFVLLGTVSYSFYLVHQPIIGLVPRVLSGLGVGGHPTVVLTICVALVLPLFFLSALMRKYIEIPSISVGYRVLLCWGERKILRRLPRKENWPTIDRAPKTPSV